MDDDLLQQILESESPAKGMKKALWCGSALRSLSQEIYYSFFSSYAQVRSPRWTAEASETALRMLQDDEGTRYCRDWLLEIAFHGNLGLVGTDSFYQNLSRISATLNHIEHEGVTRSSQYVKGLLAYAREDLSGAERAFDSLPGLHHSALLAHQAGYAAFRAPSFYRTLNDYTPEIRINDLKKPRAPDDASMFLLCAADDVYFAAFADEFAHRALDVSPSINVHFHLINSKYDPFEMIQTDVLADDRVSITAECSDSADAGTYAIMARYIVLPQLMQAWGKPVLVTDIDLLVSSDPAALEVDNGVTLSFNHAPVAPYVPAAAVMGGHNLFQPNETGLEFARLVSRYLHYMCRRGRGLWSADQVALLMVWRMLNKVMSIGKFRDHVSYGWSVPDRPLRKKDAISRLHEMSKRRDLA